MKTPLEVFTKVSEHLLTQNQKSLDARGHCRYRSETGLACAIGCLIKDEFYSHSLEYIYAVGCNTGEWQEPIRNALELSGVPIDDDTKDIVEWMQNIHDKKPVESWKYELELVKLSITDGSCPNPVFML